MAINDRDEIARVLRTARVIAVVGCSPNPMRASNSIARYLISSGYDVIPVNPGHGEMLGRPCFPDLASIPKEKVLDVVDVFRRSEHITPVADEAIARGKVGFFWMQDGIEDAAAADRLAAAGIGVAMDRCIYRDREMLRRSGVL